MRQRTVARAVRAFFVLALIGASLATASIAAASPSYSRTVRDARSASRALLRSAGAPSMSVALVSGSRVVWAQGFGYADKATGAHPQATTMYGIGSVSKMFATVAAMRLVEQGKISLDTPLTRYVPAFTMASPEYRQVTVRMLLNHSSGFPGSEYRDCISTEYVPDYAAQMMRALATQRLKYTPGFMTDYCNDGFTMIEELVAAVTGKSYAQFVQDEILTPLGMAHTAFPIHAFADGTYAKGYTGTTANPQEYTNTLASGGAYSTPSDMARLAAMLMNGGAYKDTRILSAASVAAMAEDQTVNTFNPVPSNAIRYGLGWDSIAEGGLAAVGVTGWLKGGDTSDYHASFTLAPKAHLAVIVEGVAPLDSGKCEALGQRILLRALVEKGTLEHMPQPLVTKTLHVRRASSARLAAIEGVWAMSGMTFKVAAEPGDPQRLDLWQLRPDGWAKLSGGLRLRADGRFWADAGTASLRAVDAGGRSYLVLNGPAGYGHYRGDSLIGQKLGPEEALSSAWSGRVGRSWLLVNEVPGSSDYSMDGGPVMSLGEIPGLAGYVTALLPGYGLQVQDPGTSDGVAVMFLQIPLQGSRDMEDLAVVPRGAEEWMTYGDEVYRPQASVPVLAAGGNTVVFGPEGYAEWRTTPAAGTLHFDQGTAWRLFGSDMAYVAGGRAFPATTSAAARAYLVLFGPAGSSATVTFTPAVGLEKAAAAAAAAGTHPRAFTRLR